MDCRRPSSASVPPGCDDSRLPRLAYGPLDDQVLDLTLPDAAAPHPVAVLLHGGGWQQRYGLQQMAGVAADLAGHGWAAANVEYRRLGPHGDGGYPRTLEDVVAAVDALADVELPLDLDRVVTIGHSAGGQLALWLASRNHEPHRVRIAGTVGQAPVCDLEYVVASGISRGWVEAFCGGTPEQVPAHYRDASPAMRLPYGVPSLIVHGRADPLVPLAMSERFVAAAQAGGDDCRLVVHEHDGHFEHLDARSPAWRSVTDWLTRFE